MTYGNEKGATSTEVVPLCGIFDNYRTIIEDICNVWEFVEWYLLFAKKPRG